VTDPRNLAIYGLPTRIVTAIDVRQGPRVRGGVVSELSEAGTAEACWWGGGQVKFGERHVMARGQQIVCTQCDKTEEYCRCDKYCTICKGQHNVKLCADGLYYCPECREACDVSLAND
jgi:hypothetical protein